MKYRRLKDGTIVDELDKATTLHVRTKCPEKYKLIDMETGEVYTGTVPEDGPFYWKKIDK